MQASPPMVACLPLFAAVNAQTCDDCAFITSLYVTSGVTDTFCGEIVNAFHGVPFPVT